MSTISYFENVRDVVAYLMLDRVEMYAIFSVCDKICARDKKM